MNDAILFGISRLTKSDIFDLFQQTDTCWYGKSTPAEALSSVYPLEDLPSYDNRMPTAASDIAFHTEHFADLEDDWVFADDRFELTSCSDQKLLLFLCMTVHPERRRTREETEELVAKFNNLLAPDSWKIVADGHVSGRTLYSFIRLGPDEAAIRFHVEAIGNILSTEYVEKQIERLNIALSTDPELAIGQAKELAETVCKEIASRHNISVPKSSTFPGLVKAIASELGLLPETIDNSVVGSATIRKLLGSLSQIATSMAELRNSYGTGHGKLSSHKGLQTRHAHLAVGSVVLLVRYLLETHIEWFDS